MPHSLADYFLRVLRGKAARWLLLALIVEPVAAAGTSTPVSIELLLALDVSASVDSAEFDLQMQGIAHALRDPDVLKAVENLKPLGVALGISQWGGPGETRMVIPFAQLVTARDAKAFGFVASRSYRFIGATSTSVSTAMLDGIDILKSNEFDGQRTVIDISGDGRNNSGPPLGQAREAARAAGITVNGLAVNADESDLADYYRENVITGAGSFVIHADDFEDFARAMREKLLRELRPLGS
jgi:hypothetical protein